MPANLPPLESVPPDPEKQSSLGRATAAYTKPAEAASLSEAGFVDQAPAGSKTPVTEAPGTRIGPYKLLQEIGEGGMGTVFMAEQLEPVRRMVALKVIKPGMDSKEVLARFEAERQALALMDHPNIAKVLDSGTTDSGRPYFGMELVKGIPITKYCDEHQLTPRERLQLFIPVCQAIQHAHQKGVIHRDIKPSNVLVASYDGKPVPKVIDFGVAKAMGQKLTERTMFTALGHIIGTFEYMSPEQAELNALDIDTRSDIYSLGVLLYQLLTGSTPLSRKKLKEAAVHEALRMIREEEPPKPSTRLSGSESLPSISAQRKTEPAKLTKMLRGELDWIVMKALEKDRSRRYDTANAFARDIERFLNDEPVEACPPSAGYRLRKFARRYKTPLLVAAVIAFLLIGGLFVSSGLAIRASRAETLATAERDRAVKAENDALANERKALANEKEAGAVLEFLLDKVLAAARPERELGGLGFDVTLRAAVDAAEPKIADAFREQPLAEAGIRHTLGLTYFYLAEYDLATPQLRRALSLRQAKLGPEHPDTIATSVATKENLAWTYLSDGRAAAAVPLLEETLKLRKATLGPENPYTLSSMNSLGNAYLRDGQLNKALAMHEESLKLRKTKFGPGSPAAASSMGRLGATFLRMNKLAEAEAMLRGSLSILEEKQPDDWTTFFTASMLGASLLGQKKYADAEPLLLRGYEGIKQRESTISVANKGVLVVVLHRIIQLYDETEQQDKAAKWRKELEAVQKKEKDSKK